jgi:hypothetical protein
MRSKLKSSPSAAVHFGFPLRQISFHILNSSFASRHGQFIKDFLDDRFAGFFLGPGFVGNGFLIPRPKVVTQSSHGCHGIEIV